MKGLILITAASIFMSSSVCAFTGFGSCNFGKETVSNVICYGPVVLKETTISGAMKVAGFVKASGVTVGAMTVAGAVTIENSKVKGPVNIVGTLSATNVEFDKDVSVTSNSVTLSNTKLNSSIKVTYQQAKPSLIIQCGTIVTGNITFTGKPGLVQMTDDSSLQGKIINGTQAFLQKKC